MTNKMFTAKAATDAALSIFANGPKFEIKPFQSEIFSCEEYEPPPPPPPKKSALEAFREKRELESELRKARNEAQTVRIPPKVRQKTEAEQELGFRPDGPQPHVPRIADKEAPCMRCLRRSARCRVGTGGPDQMLRTTINWSAYRKATEEAKGLDPLKLRSSPKLGYGMVIDSKRLQVMEECVAGKLRAVKTLGDLSQATSKHAHAQNARIEDAVFYRGNKGLNKTVRGNVTRTEKFRQFVQAEMLVNNHDPWADVENIKRRGSQESKVSG